MQQRQVSSKILKVKDFVEFKNLVQDHIGQEFYILYFSSLGQRTKDLYLLNELKRLIMSSEHASPSNDILIVDVWDVPEAFTFFPEEIISLTPTLVLVQSSGSIRVSDHLSFIERELSRAMILPSGIRLM